MGNVTIADEEPPGSLLGRPGSSTPCSCSNQCWYPLENREPFDHVQFALWLEKHRLTSIGEILRSGERTDLFIVIAAPPL